jgi:hypothetical protein
MRSEKHSIVLPIELLDKTRSAPGLRSQPRLGGQMLKSVGDASRYDSRRQLHRKCTVTRTDTRDAARGLERRYLRMALARRGGAVPRLRTGRGAIASSARVRPGHAVRASRGLRGLDGRKPMRADRHGQGPNGWSLSTLPTAERSGIREWHTRGNEVEVTGHGRRPLGPVRRLSQADDHGARAVDSRRRVLSDDLYVSLRSHQERMR